MRITKKKIALKIATTMVDNESTLASGIFIYSTVDGITMKLQDFTKTGLRQLLKEVRTFYSSRIVLDMKKTDGYSIVGVHRSFHPNFGWITTLTVG